MVMLIETESRDVGPSSPALAAAALAVSATNAVRSVGRLRQFTITSPVESNCYRAEMFHRDAKHRSGMDESGTAHEAGDELEHRGPTSFNVSSGPTIG